MDHIVCQLSYCAVRKGAQRKRAYYAYKHVVVVFDIIFPSLGVPFLGTEPNGALPVRANKSRFASQSILFFNDPEMCAVKQKRTPNRLLSAEGATIARRTMARRRHCVFVFNNTLICRKVSCPVIVWFGHKP